MPAPLLPDSSRVRRVGKVILLLVATILGVSLLDRIADTVLRTDKDLSPAPRVGTARETERLGEKGVGLRRV